MGGATPGTPVAAPPPHGPGATSSPALLAHRVAATLVGDAGDDAGALAACFHTSVRDAASYETSVRCTTDGQLVAGRMMIEQASRPVVDAIARALDVALPADAERWLSVAAEERLPIIAGWDQRGSRHQRCIKLYVNASDASRDVRARVCAVAGIALPPAQDSPAVIGMNARADGVVERKVYLQGRDAVALAEPHGSAARQLAAVAREENADAGGVLSFELDGPVPRARAFFVALREPPDSAPWRCVEGLAGYDAALIETLLPFSPAAPRSVGISLSDGTWTLYCKPRGSTRAPETLEPAAVFRAGGVEVGVFVEPTHHAARAFRRTEHHAVSVRVRAGTAPAPRALDELIDWFAACLRIAERTGEDVAGRIQTPPPPWRLVDNDPPHDLDREGA